MYSSSQKFYKMIEINCQSMVQVCDANLLCTHPIVVALLDYRGHGLLCLNPKGGYKIDHTASKNSVYMLAHNITAAAGKLKQPCELEDWEGTQPSGNLA